MLRIAFAVALVALAAYANAERRVQGIDSPCTQPSAPDVPRNSPIHRRAEKRLNRAVARFLKDSAEYIACLGTDNRVDPSTVAAKEHTAVSAVEGLINLYATRVGPSDKLIEAIERPWNRLAAAHGIIIDVSAAIVTLNVAVADINAGRYAEARAEIAGLDFGSLSPYERSKAEQLLYIISYRESKFSEAREHAQKSIDAHGLPPNDLLNAQLAIAEIDIQQGLRAQAAAKSSSGRKPKGDIGEDEYGDPKYGTSPNASLYGGGP